jgi:thymidylate kinase
MSKPETKNARKEKKIKSKKAAGKTGAMGTLVALEGTNGPALLEEAERLARLCRDHDEPAWSRWDASGTFFELRLGKAKTLTPTPRTLMLLYASDLLFRLRWEITPAMNEGRTVVAAPYVESAIGLGVAAGLPKEWLTELFGFAPKPDASFRLKEKTKAKGKDKKAGKAMSGFVEFCCSTLGKNNPDWSLVEVRAGMLKYFDSLEEREEIRRLGKKLPKHWMATNEHE